MIGAKFFSAVLLVVGLLGISTSQAQDYGRPGRPGAGLIEDRVQVLERKVQRLERLLDGGGHGPGPGPSRWSCIFYTQSGSFYGHGQSQREAQYNAAADCARVHGTQKCQPRPGDLECFQN